MPSLGLLSRLTLSEVEAMVGDVFQPGDICGKWEIIKLLGQGGFAEVYLVLGPKGELRALKCLRLKHRANKDLQRRLGDEAKLLSYIENVHVVKFFEAGIERLGGNRGEIIWVALEYIEGKTLRDLRHALRNKLPIERVLRWFIQVANGLAVAHQIRVVHRDLKPENIMIDVGDIAHIVDFGIAKLQGWGVKSTTKGKNLGTASYISPEQVDDPKSVDNRSDIYSFGISLYECLRGRHPFGGVDENDEPTVGEMVARQMAQQAVPLARLIPDFPADVSAIVEKTMEKDPARRFQAMKDVENALSAALDRQMGKIRSAALCLTAVVESTPSAPPAQVATGGQPFELADELGPTGPMPAGGPGASVQADVEREAKQPSLEEPVLSGRPRRTITLRMDSWRESAPAWATPAEPDRRAQLGYLDTEPIGAPPAAPIPAERSVVFPAAVAGPRRLVTEPLPDRPASSRRRPPAPLLEGYASVWAGSPWLPTPLGQREDTRHAAPRELDPPAPWPAQGAPAEDPGRASPDHPSPVYLTAQREALPLGLQRRRAVDHAGTWLVSVLGHRVTLVLAGLLCGASLTYATVRVRGLGGSGPVPAAALAPSVTPMPSSNDGGPIPVGAPSLDAPPQEPAQEPAPAVGGSATTPSASAVGVIAEPKPKPRRASPPKAPPPARSSGATPKRPLPSKPAPRPAEELPYPELLY